MPRETLSAHSCSEVGMVEHKDPSRTIIDRCRTVVALAAILEAASQVADRETLHAFRSFGICPTEYPLRSGVDPTRTALVGAVSSWRGDLKSASLDWVKSNATW